MIKLVDALQQMQRKDEQGNYVPFSIVVVKYSVQRGEGGQVARFDNVRLTDKKTNDSEELDSPMRQNKNAVRSNRQPANYINKTRNVQFPNGEIRKFRIRLLAKFNDETVVY